MSTQKPFGVWMDNFNAIIVGKQNPEDETLTVIAHVSGEDVPHNSSEKNQNNHERGAETKFFKEITSHMQNATHVHVTGTGISQEKFIHFLADTPQFKNTHAEESTSNKMSDERLAEYISEKFK